MREARLGEYTLRSHGFKIAKSHWRDWVILVLLFALEGFLNLINPFHRYVDKYAMNDLKYPLHDTTVPMWAVPIVVVLLPAIIFLGIYYRKRDAYDLHHALLGLLFSIGMTAVITDALKDAAGRPRPDFFWRCFPDGIELYDPVTGNVICHGKASVVKQGYKSFPSGHTSWSFAGLTFLSLYLSGKIEAFDRKGHVAKLCIVFLPLLVATVIGISLVDDYWHHWQDVVVGGLIGLIMAAFCYLQFFPAPYHIEGWRTYAHCRMLEETCATTDSTTNNPTSVRNQQPEAGNNLSTPGARNGETPLEDLESGRT